MRSLTAALVVTALLGGLPGWADDADESAASSEASEDKAAPAAKSFDKKTIERNQKKESRLQLRPSVAGGGYLGIFPFEGGPVLSSTLGLQVDDMPWLRVGLEARLSSPFELLTGWAEYAELAFTLGMTYDFDFESFSLHPLGNIHAGGNLGWGLTLAEPMLVAVPTFGFSLGGMVSLPSGLHVIVLGHYPATPILLTEFVDDETYASHHGSLVYFTARVGWMWDFPYGG